MARWRSRPERAIPGWVRQSWVFGDNADAADEWLEALADSDPEFFHEALTECLSTPSYWTPSHG